MPVDAASIALPPGGNGSELCVAYTGATERLPALPVTPIQAYLLDVGTAGVFGCSQLNHIPDLMPFFNYRHSDSSSPQTAPDASTP